MKYFLPVCFLLCSFSATTQSIEFDTTSASWKAVIEKAKKMNKPVFVDAYTSWCGPCKWMDAKVFTEKEVSSLFNTNFLSVKIDAEKGMGISFARDYKINAFPTLLFFSPKGEMLLAGIGSKSPEALLEIATHALHNWKNGISLEDMKMKAASGNYDSEFLLNYVKKLSSLQLPNSLIVEEYLKIIPKDSLFTQRTLEMVRVNYFGRMPTDGMAFQVLFNAYKKYPVKSFELMSPWNTIRNRLLQYADSAGKLKDSVWLTEIIDGSNKIDSVTTTAEREKSFLLCIYYAASRDTNRLKEQAKSYAENYVLNESPDSLYKRDQGLFKKALMIKFKSSDEVSLQANKDYQNFLRSYFSEARLVVTELQEIIFLCEQLKVSTLSKDSYLQWLKKAIVLYESNPVFVNSSIVKRMQDSYKKLNEQSN